MRSGLLLCALAGCLYNPTVDVDTDSLEIARGTSRDVVVKVDGEITHYVVWAVDDPMVATVTPAWDGSRLTIGGSFEGETVVHVNSHGQTIDLPVRVDPPAVVQIWIEPDQVTTKVGGHVPVRAVAVDTIFRLHDITRDSQWTVRDPTIASLDMAGMVVQAMGEGTTTLDVMYGEAATLAPITIFK